MAKRPVLNASVTELTERYRAAVQIDRHTLDTQVEQQPQLYFELCEQQIQAFSRRDEAKEALAHVDAELSNALRAEAATSGSKLTESAISDRVTAHPDHTAAVRVHDQLRLEADRWTVLRATFEQRAKMLHELVSLYASGYFTVTPRVQAQAQGVAAARGRVALDAARRGGSPQI